LSFLSSLISLQQSCLANAWDLTTEVGRDFLSRALEGAHYPILLHSLVTGLRGGNSAACAAVPAAGYRMDRSIHTKDQRWQKPGN
jgi:hypothetical protein